METLDPEVRSDVELAAQIWARRRRGQDQRWVASCMSSMLSAACGSHHEVAAHLPERDAWQVSPLQNVSAALSI